MDDAYGRTYPNGDYYEFATGIMYYANGATGYFDYAPDMGGDAGVIPDQALANEAAVAADDGWTLKGFTDGLLQLGYTAAQLATLYQNVEASKQLTPVALTNLQQERQYLQQHSATQNTMWLWAAIGVGLVLVVANRR